VFTPFVMLARGGVGSGQSSPLFGRGGSGSGARGLDKARRARHPSSSRRLVLVGAVAWVMLSASVALLAQAASLVGVVAGPGGEGIPGVTVRVLTGSLWPGDSLVVSELTTDAAGRFSAAGLSPGTYDLELLQAGRRLRKVSGLELSSVTTLEVTVELLSGAAATGEAATSSFRIENRGVDWGAGFGLPSRRRLPNAGNVWSILESQEPSIVTDRLDVGGLKTGVPALFGALGASWTENQYTLNGFDVTDPYIPGRPLADPDLDAVLELQTVSAAKPAPLAASGVALDFTTPRLLESLHGSTRWYYSGRSLQSDNQDARLARFDFPGPERFRRLVDGNVELGGKLPFHRVSWPFFAALSTQQLSKTLGGFSAPIDVHVYRALAEAEPLASGPDRLRLLYSGQHVFNSHEGAEPHLASSATTLGNHNFHQFQARWERALTPGTALAAGFGVAHAIVSSGIQSHLDSLSAVTLPQMSRSGPAPLSLAGLRTRYEGKALIQAVKEGPLGNHSFAFGGDWERSYVSNRWDSLGGMEQTFVRGVGAEVTRWNTPTAARQQVQNVAVFAHDAWRPWRRLRLPLGFRLDSASGQAAGAAEGIRWTTLQPRAGLVLPLLRRGPVLRASWSRYAHLLQGRYLDFGNPTALGGEVFRWLDLNSDRQAQPQEITTLLRVFGGPHSALDHGLARPFTDEISVGLDQDFGPRFRASVRFFRRDTHRLIALANMGVPLASYTPVEVVDPGNDGIPGNADDQLLTLYNRNPAALGQDFFLLTNPPPHRASYKGFEIRLTKPLLHLWAFSASFTAMRTLAATNPGNSVWENDPGFVGSLGTDPNTLVLATSRTYFDRAFIGKATGYYFAPGGFQLGAVVKYYDGLPFGRLLFVEGFNQGPFFVRATPRAHPGGFQTQFNLTLDVRVAREFAFRRGTLAGYLDFFNLLNLNMNTLEADLTGPTFESRVPLAIQAPRVARLGFEWRF